MNTYLLCKLQIIRKKNNVFEQVLTEEVYKNLTFQKLAIT